MKEGQGTEHQSLGTQVILIFTLIFSAKVPGDVARNILLYYFYQVWKQDVIGE